MTRHSNLIGARELNQCLAQPDWRIVDCRFDLGDPDAGFREYLAAHIPGAVFADLDRDLAAPIGPETGRHPLPAVSAFETFLGRIGIDDATQVVVYDHADGALASRAWWLLRWAGHRHVRLLNGGFAAWQREGLPTGHGDEQAVAGTYRVRPKDERVISTREIVEAGDRIGELRLVDARNAERFRGEQEPIDPVAGHIPGSINLPLTASVNEDGTWKTREQLEALWCEVLGADKSKPWAVMCGSGVTACHLALSGLEAGYVEPRLYVGSWSEWIRDPDRPVAVGPG